MISLVVLGLLGCALLATPAVVRWQVQRAAERVGVRLSVDEVGLGPGAIWLSGCTFESARLGGLTGRFSHVEVLVGMGGVRGVTVHGGAVRLNASRADLVKAFRGNDGVGVEDGDSRRGYPVVAKGVFFEWQAARGEVATAWGVSVAQRSPGYAVSLDLARVAHPSVQLEVRDANVVIDGSFLVREAVARSTAVVIDAARTLDSSGSPRAPTGTGVSGASTGPGGPPVPVLAGPLDVISRLDPSRGEKLRARVAHYAGLVARRLPEGGALDLSGVVIRLQRGIEGLTLGPARVRIQREPSFVFFSFEPSLEVEAQRRFALTARLPIVEGDTEVDVEGGPVKLSSLGVREGDLGLQGVEQAEVQVKAELLLSDDGKRLSASSSGQLEGLSLGNPRLGPLPLTGITLGWNVRGSLSTDGSALAIDSGEVSLGAVRVNVELELDRQPNAFAFSTRLRVPLGSCAEMLASLPGNLVPFANEMRLSGTFSWSMGLGFDSARLSEMDLDWRMQNDCRFERIPEELSPERFKSAFYRQVPDADGQPLTVVTGPGTESWVPITEVSRFLEAAVLVSEDGRFWSHRGFDQRAIESSIRQNVQAQRFVRGASTISMQLAKNLYLTREKTVTRKIQEAVLTMLLEQNLRKDEILELYFNVVELAPGVYGVGPAAEHYFASVPADLSVAQAFFLASILPSPNSQRFDETGRLKPQWRSYVDRLMRIAAERGRITEADLERGLAEEVRFGVPASFPWETPDGAPGFAPEDLVPF